LRKFSSYLEIAGGFLICALAAVTPWLFGTTEDWSVRLMNIGCLAAGLIFLLGCILKRRSESEAQATSAFSRNTAIVFFSLNVVLLGYCAIAYFNPRATFSFETLDFTYFDKYNSAIPTTYDRNLTGQTLLDFFCLFVFFWSARSWLDGGWEAALRRARANPTVYNNRRFRVLLWVLTLNAILLALQGTFQRLSHSEKLLWMRDSWWKSHISCFGPFSYRGNAAEYFNLIWPLSFAFAILVFKNRRLSHDKKTFEGPQLLLIPGLIMLAVAPFLTLSRGGAVIAAAGLTVFLFLLISEYSHSRKMRIRIVLGFIVLGMAVWLSASKDLLKRFETEKSGLSARAEIYENAKKITEDYPRYGTGPGTFRAVYHLYRPDITQEWHAFVHDDWLETRVTLGWVGFCLVLLQLITLAVWIFSKRRAPVSRLFIGCIAISLVGTLAKAKFDFPFQTYSILFTFVLVSAIAVSSASPLPTEGNFEERRES
jgi:hypothetical protein